MHLPIPPHLLQPMGARDPTLRGNARHPLVRRRAGRKARRAHTIQVDLGHGKRIARLLALVGLVGVVVVVVVAAPQLVLLALQPLVLPEAALGEDAEDPRLLARGLPCPVLAPVVVFGLVRAAREDHHGPDHAVEGGVDEEAAGCGRWSGQKRVL